MRIKLKTYLAQLEYNETFKPEGERLEVPTVTALAKEARITRTQMSRIVGGEIKSLKLDVADSIIQSLRRRGFRTDIPDLLEYREGHHSEQSQANH